MKNRRIATVLCILLVFIFSFIVAKNTFKENKLDDEKNREEVVIKANKDIEYASSLTYNDFLSMLIKEDIVERIKNIDIIVNDKSIKDNETYVFEKLGTFEIKINYTFDSINYQEKVTWNVKDTKAPKLEGVKNIEIFLGDKLNYKDVIKAFDECDGEVEVRFDGEVNESKAGNYKVTATAIDSSNNMTSETFYVTINKKTTTTMTTKKSTTKTTKEKTKKTEKVTSKTTKKTTTEAGDVSTKSGRLALAKKEAKNVIKRIIKPGMSDAEKAQAISTYLYQNVDKQLNQSNEAYKTNYGNEAYAALIMKIAACSGFCKAVTLLCNEAGLKSQHINANQWTHQWNKVYVDGKWQVLDAQIGHFGGTVHPVLGE